MDEKHINWQYEDGDAFFVHEVSVNFTPVQIVIDMKNITPRVDQRTRTGPVFKVRHNVVMFDPYHAKKYLGLLTQVVQRYEKEFGKIAKPKAIEKLEAKQKSKKSDDKKGPTYFG
ncbi:hypothetical protein HN695_07855 [Candidatus Woesearchaeota archaeon]|nr:hypothetical protein [Candidatus Woesearchaeota archaeon]MBT5272414.1 hypothetical protein [Candidatus Woesearchaeota archaeon]MBT6041244.1 hypothetical protein [Candidatus Woesearchaeota archaeon]MBT6337468.1 hypothetical protein [Candidatus Woesearchaeota archaeon]MBT7928219.1 hypothetical protein [Candidatus Woesearchaeota archaeon]